MKERRRTFPEIMLEIAIAAIGCMLFNIPTHTGESMPVTVYILLFVFALISYTGNRLFLKNPKSLTAAVIFNLILFFAGFAAAFGLHLVTGAVSGVFLGAFFLILLVMAFRESVKGISINMLTACFDALAVLLMIYILAAELGAGQLSAAIPGVLGITAAFAGIIVYRDGNGISGRDRLYMVLIIALVLAAAYLLHLLAGDSLREGFAGMMAGIRSALAWLGRLFEKILLFLKGLFPEEQYEAVDMEMGDGFGMPAGEGMEENDFSAAPVFILVGVFLLAAATAAFIIYRKHRFSGKRNVIAAAEKPGRRTDRISLWKALKIWATEKMYRIRVRLCFLKNRHSPVGRFYKLVRSKKHTGSALRQGETPSEFLNRYIESLKPGDKRIPELKALINDLNIQLYNR